MFNSWPGAQTHNDGFIYDFLTDLCHEGEVANRDVIEATMPKHVLFDYTGFHTVRFHFGFAIGVVSKFKQFLH